MTLFPPNTKRKCAVLTGPTMSETWDTVVPEAAPRYMTLAPGLMWIWSTPPKMAAASLERNGFQALYSILVSPSYQDRSEHRLKVWSQQQEEHTFSYLA